MSKASLINILPNIPQQNIVPALYIVPTPIGNLLDITLRGLFILAKADIIYCEDKRVTSRLLQQFGIKTKLDIYNDFSKDKTREAIEDHIKENKIVALVSDAGTPIISDPGHKLVRYVISKGLQVVSLPGANAVLPALCNSGIASDRFTFVGFLNNKSKAMEDFINSMLAEETYIMYQSPNRIIKTLEIINDTNPQTYLCISKELTKLHENNFYGTAAQILEQLADIEKIKGEFVICLNKPKQTSHASEEEIINYAKKLLSDNSASGAAKLVAENFDISKNKAYKIIINLK